MSLHRHQRSFQSTAAFDTSARQSILAWLAESQIPPFVVPSALGKRKRSNSPASDPGQVTWALDMNQNASAYVTPERSFADRPSVASWASRPPSAKSSSTGQFAKDAYSVKKAMEQHGIMQDVDTALKRYPIFEQEMREIVIGQRLSAMKTDEVERFQRMRQRVGSSNEDTVLNNLLPLIISKQYLVIKDLDNEVATEKHREELAKAVDEDERDKIRRQYIYTSQFWEDDGLLVTTNAEFERTQLPNLYEDLGFENELARALSKADGMKNPKPDRCFGLDPECFPVPQDIALSQDIHTLLRIAPYIMHPFLIVEGKASKGDIAEARNQAARGGATLVRAFRILLAEIYPSRDDDTTQLGPDRATICFSVTFSPDIIEFWINWADVVAQKPVQYHMNLITGAYLRLHDSVVESRRMLHNIINWGCNTRRNDLNRFHEALHRHQRKEQADLESCRTETGPRASKRRKTQFSKMVEPLSKEP